MEMVPSPLYLLGKWVGPVQKIKTYMSCSRSEEEEVKKSVSKADVLGYFTSLINKKNKNSKEFWNVPKRKNARVKYANNFAFLFIKYADLCCSDLFVQVLNDRQIMRLDDFWQIIFLRHLVFHLIRPG